VLSKDAVIVWPYKLVLGKQNGKGWWTGPVHPNASQASIKDNDPGCPDGCVFNIEEDPAEHVDISGSQQGVKANLTRTLATIMAGAYQTNDTPGYTNCVTDSVYAKAHGNFLGPRCTKG